MIFLAFICIYACKKKKWGKVLKFIMHELIKMNWIYINSLICQLKKK